MNGGMEGSIDRQRLIFPALGDLYQSVAPYSYAIIRFCMGAVVIYHGYMKLFGGMATPVANKRSEGARLPGAARLGLFSRHPGVFRRRGAGRRAVHSPDRADVHG